VASGGGAIRRWKLCSIRPVSGAGPATPNPPAHSAAVTPWGSSSRGQRVAAGLGDDPGPDPLVQPTGDDRGQQRSRVRIDQSL
jgi:hypothetical protein